jgi:hypothetical protein
MAAENDHEMDWQKFQWNFWFVTALRRRARRQSAGADVLQPDSRRRDRSSLRLRIRQMRWGIEGSCFAKDGRASVLKVVQRWFCRSAALRDGAVAPIRIGPNAQSCKTPVEIGAGIDVGACQTPAEKIKELVGLETSAGHAPCTTGPGCGIVLPGLLFGSLASLYRKPQT